jgi:hypothetical protein
MRCQTVLFSEQRIRLPRPIAIAPESQSDTMRKGLVAIWTILTFALGFGMFAFAMPLFNRMKSDGLAKAYTFLLFPVLFQVVWCTAGAIHSRKSRRREVIVGMLVGVGLEFAALVILILISASAHY